LQRGRGRGDKTLQLQLFSRDRKDLKKELLTEQSTKELLGFAFDFIVCALISWTFQAVLN
jgi:hypothetical protein